MTKKELQDIKINIRISKETYDRLNEWCSENGTTKSSITRTLIENHLLNEELEKGSCGFANCKECNPKDCE